MTFFLLSIALSITANQSQVLFIPGVRVNDWSCQYFSLYQSLPSKS